MAELGSQRKVGKLQSGDERRFRFPLAAAVLVCLPSGRRDDDDNDSYNVYLKRCLKHNGQRSTEDRSVKRAVVMPNCDSDRPPQSAIAAAEMATNRGSVCHDTRDQSDADVTDNDEQCH